jgi:hypothetical protein
MTERGFQEDGEAAGKWRRALLTSTQLSTYFVGYSEVSAIGAAAPRRRARAGLARPHARARFPVPAPPPRPPDRTLRRCPSYAQNVKKVHLP